jgi:hypothetical protein
MQRGRASCGHRVRPAHVMTRFLSVPSSRELMVACCLVFCSAGCASKPQAAGPPDEHDVGGGVATGTAGMTATAGTTATSSMTGRWKSGVNGDPVINRASVEAFCTWRGRTCAMAMLYTDRQSWDSMTRNSGWLFDAFAGFPGQLAISQGLVPDDHGSDLAACAAGDHDKDFHELGALMVRKHRADSIVRLGWEFNGTYMPWSATNTQRWKDCYRHAALAIRSANPSALLDWTINSHGTPHEACDGISTNCYPGDDVVDIIGIDNYDMAPSANSAAEFAAIGAAPDGLDWLYAFAMQHGKKFSVGEWGTAPGGKHNTNGENPAFIQWMYDWFVAHAANLSYESYFNDCQRDEVGSNLYRPVGPGCNRQNVNAGNVYRSLFGPQAAVGVTDAARSDDINARRNAAGAAGH